MTASGRKKPAPAASAKLLAPFAVGCAGLAADLWTKQVFYWSAPRQVIPGFFSIEPRPNTGGVFGLFDHLSVANPLFIAVSACAILLIGLMLLKTPAQGNALGVSTGLILGGAVGNLVDRILYGHVRDFLDFHVGSFSWPTFNVADSLITVGTGFLAWVLWRKPAHEA